MHGHGEKLSRKMDQALAALLTQPTLGTAATAAGVSERTIRNWLRLPTFVREYHDRRRAVYDQAVAVAQRMAITAIAILGRNMTCGHKPTETRAALAVLDIAGKGVQADLADRLAELERLTADKLGKGRGAAQ